MISLMDEIHSLKSAFEEKQNNKLTIKDDSSDNTKDNTLEENQSNELKKPDVPTPGRENILDEPISSEENNRVEQRNKLISRINIFA